MRHAGLAALARRPRSAEELGSLMPINKRGPKSWQVKVRSHAGTWWTITVHSRTEAERTEREMFTAKDRGETWVHPRYRQGWLTVREACEVFMVAQRGRLSTRTYLRYARELEDFTVWGESQFRPFLMSRFGRPLLRRYYAHLSGDKSGRWGRKRTVKTSNKILQTVQILWKWAYEHDDELGWEGLIPRSRRLELPTPMQRITVAPTWGEMDDLIGELEGLEWARRAAWIQRFTALRIGEVMGLTWAAVHLQERQLFVAPEISKGGYSGRILPLSDHLIEELKRWPRTEGPLCGPIVERLRDTSRPARAYSRAWMRAQVRELAWKRQPTHALRKGVISGLRGLGADGDAVELFAGHKLAGVKVSYLDHEIAFNLRAVVDLIPAVGESA